MPMQRLKVRKALTPRQRRHRRVRAKVSGTPQRPRLNVFRSGQHIYAQVIDDVRRHTLVAAGSTDPELRTLVADGDGMTKTERAQWVGRTIATKAQAEGITQIVFDRGGFLYHGRIRALADAAREGGLDF
jgi:large subunit ribosomal protein L18